MGNQNEDAMLLWLPERLERRAMEHVDLYNELRSKDPLGGGM